MTGEGRKAWKTLTLDGKTNKFAGGNTYWNLPHNSAVGVGDWYIDNIYSSHFPSIFGGNASLDFIYTTEAAMTKYFQNADALNDYLAAQYAAGTPVQLCYKLATPTPFTATGAQPIPALAGVNTVLTDADSATVTGCTAKDIKDSMAQISENKEAVNRLKEELSSKIDKPSTAPEVGKILKVTAVNDDGTFVCEWADAPSGGGTVDDVKIDGKSIVSDGVADIPYAGDSNGDRHLGVVGVNGHIGNVGVGVTNRGRLILNTVNEIMIDTRKSGVSLLTVVLLDYAVKAAMCDGKGGAWTDAERIAALLRMGCTVDDNGFVKWTAQEVTE